MGRVAQGIARTLIGGGAAVIAGGRFQEGAKTAEYAYLFNDVAHQSAGKAGRALTADERAIYADHFPGEVLDSARVFEGKVPWWLRSDMDGITLGKKIYFRDDVYAAGTASFSRLDKFFHRQSRGADEGPERSFRHFLVVRY